MAVIRFVGVDGRTGAVSWKLCAGEAEVTFVGERVAVNDAAVREMAIDAVRALIARHTARGRTETARAWTAWLVRATVDIRAAVVTREPRRPPAPLDLFAAA